jgi:uncharacterized protein YndB with AHSA1/START domain
MEKASVTDEKEIYNFRIINSSPEKIFSAFSEAGHLQNWWGPSGFSNTFRDFNFWDNGEWNFVMRGPDGVDYENISVFREIAKPEKIVIEHLNAPHFVLTITLEKEEDKTRIGWRMLFDSAEIRDNVAKYAVKANEENFDRLERELALIK